MYLMPHVFCRRRRFSNHSNPFFTGRCLNFDFMHASIPTSHSRTYTQEADSPSLQHSFSLSMEHFVMIFCLASHSRMLRKFFYPPPSVGRDGALWSFISGIGLQIHIKAHVESWDTAMVALCVYILHIVWVLAVIPLMSRIFPVPRRKNKGQKSARHRWQETNKRRI